MIKRAIMFISVFMFTFILVSCDEVEQKHPENKLVGVYMLNEEIIDNFDNTSLYVYKFLEIKNDNTALIEELTLEGVNKQEGTYTNTETEVVVKIGIREYTYTYDNENETLIYEGRINRRNTTMVFKKNENFELAHDTGDVNFTDELFGEDINENFYNYAPTIIMEDNHVMHIWYCSNKESGNVTDYIAYRKGILSTDGKWTFTDKQLVLETTPGTWDERHVCDPSVIKGLFNYNDEEYLYLMAYLGCITNDSSRNEVGIAVAKSPEGPWIKIDELNPIANYYEAPEYTDDIWTWGYGQPSLVSVDKAGKVLLFYTKGVLSGTFQHADYWDLTNLNNPVKINSADLTNAGVVNSGGGIDAINNADFAYDSVNKRLYVIKEDFPYPNSGGVDWIAGTNTILYMNLDDDENFIGETLFGQGNFRWQLVTSINSEQTGFLRNHNMGIITDEYGHMLSPYQIPIIYTMSDLITDHPNWELKGQWPALHTYRMRGLIVNV